MGQQSLAFIILFFASFLVWPSAYAGTSLKLNYATISTNSSAAISDFSADDLMSVEATEFILQFKRPLNVLQKRSLNKSFQVFGYIPDDAFVVRATALQLREFQSTHSNVSGFVKYDWKFKVESELLSLSVFNKDEAQILIIRIFNASEAQNIFAKIKAIDPQALIELEDSATLSGSLTSQGNKANNFANAFHGKQFAIYTRKHFIPQIAMLTGVEHISTPPKIELYDFQTSDADAPPTLTGYESGTKLMNFDAAYAEAFTGRGQILAMADTGVDSGDVQTLTPDLHDAVIEGQAFGLRSTSWADPMGHGTHVAGLMVGRGILSDRAVHGGAIEASLIAGSMWSPLVKNMTVPSKLSTLFDAAFKSGARVHSNSWGSNKDPGAYDASAVQVDEWTYNNPDMLVVFAAGNNGADMNKDGRIDEMSLGSPGTAKNCLTVGASKNWVANGGLQSQIGKLNEGRTLWAAEPLASSKMSDNERGLAPFSSRGPTKDGRLKPDVVAPGTNILGVKSHQDGASSLWGYFSKDYTWSGGTSMAAPLTAGAAGVTRQMLIEKWGIANPSAALVKAMLLHSAEDLFPGQFGAVGAEKGQEILVTRPNVDEGYGRVNMQNMVALGSHDTETHVIDARDGVAQDQAVTYTITVTKESGLYANLVWTDAPGSPNAAAALVNDLDLELMYPDGHIWKSEDHVNNVESLELSGLTPGIYQLTIRGYRVPEGPRNTQAFALIYSVRPL
ncbi:S8 family serine peptidase [Bdellovibrio sp. NC01]|uniref:S8 family serine peptidase n=1 Tax=Bdellovibrio sp. NC01 TaxID=2220073 RepID=UPI0011573C1A|nr:S8 family serine peptidase [Bdellovibrio sp. NC01]QDK38216.1 serine protease [Bdellovibrio sp. NC01]